jgi:flavin reductase (DIM6/NTAB) family NADH-FMN oxidoreductase RutF
MQVSPAELSPSEMYKLLMGLVVPRPIAWVSTLSENNLVNLAPFSGFTFASHEPPMLVISIGSDGDNLKDTARHIERRREFVVNIADMELLPELHASSAEYASHISEAVELGLETAPSTKIATPRIARAPLSAECRLSISLDIGARPGRLIIGEILQLHIRDSVYRDGRIDTVLLNPIARLGGPRYAHLGEMISMPSVRKPGKHTSA